jgi:hypothetical protein
MPKARLIPGIEPGPAVNFSFDGQAVSGFAGESVGGALLRAGLQGTRTTSRAGERRGYYCGMGVCWECVVEIAQEGSVRGCVYPASEGLVVRSAVARSEDDL